MALKIYADDGLLMSPPSSPRAGGHRQIFAMFNVHIVRAFKSTTTRSLALVELVTLPSKIMLLMR